MISPEEFLVRKGIISTVDLDTKWNLQISRDCYIGTTKKIVSALKEYAELCLEQYKEDHEDDHFWEGV